MQRSCTLRPAPTRLQHIETRPTRTRGDQRWIEACFNRDGKTEGSLPTNAVHGIHPHVCLAGIP